MPSVVFLSRLSGHPCHHTLPSSLYSFPSRWRFLSTTGVERSRYVLATLCRHPHSAARSKSIPSNPFGDRAKCRVSRDQIESALVADHF